MPRKQINTRSKGVNEVLSTPPRFYIVWGNSLIILLLFIALYGMNLYKLPVISHLQVVNGKFYPESRLVEKTLTVHVQSYIPIRLNTKVATLNLESFEKGNPVKLAVLAHIANIDRQHNNLELYFNKNNQPPSKIAANSFSGQVAVTTDSITLYRLFVNKMFSQHFAKP